MIYFTIFEMLNYVLSIYLEEQLFKITPFPACSPEPGLAQVERDLSHNTVHVME